MSKETVGNILAKKSVFYPLQILDSVTTAVTVAIHNSDISPEFNPLTRFAYDHMGFPGIFVQKGIGVVAIIGLLSLLEKQKNGLKISRRIVQGANILFGVTLVNNVASFFV